MSGEPLPLIYYEFDDFTEPWRQPPAEVALLHHGLGGNGNLYRPWVPLLGDRYRVLRVDARGQGRTPMPPGYRFALERFAEDIAELLDQLEIERVHWVGASGGGIIGQHAALAMPERIASLSLLATTPRFKGPADFAGWLAPLDRGDVCAFFSGDLERRFGTDQPERTAWIIGEIARTPGPLLADLHRWVRTVDLTAELGRIRCPTLVVTGERDTLTDLDDARILSRRIPNARLEVVKGLPHNIAYTHPHLTAGIVRRFLDEMTGADGGS